MTATALKTPGTVGMGATSGASHGKRLNAAHRPEACILKKARADKLGPLRALSPIALAHLPTRMERMVRLGQHIGLNALWVKRDDCTGLGVGGNKVRKLEFDLAAAIEQGADCIVCGGVVQSNTARQVAAACAKIGLECHLGMMRGRLAHTETGYEETGNILLNRLFGAIIHDIPWDEDRNRRLHEIAEQLKGSGRRPYLVPYGASDALGALGYVLAAEEIICERPDVKWIVHASGSAGTQAGLIAGLLALGHGAHVIGIDVDAQPERVRRDVCRVGREAAKLLGVEDRWRDEAVEVAGDWSAGAYGVADATTEEAIRLTARMEALALDPVYAGKGMAAFTMTIPWFGFTRAEFRVFLPIPRRWPDFPSSIADFCFARTEAHIGSSASDRVLVKRCWCQPRGAAGNWWYGEAWSKVPLTPFRKSPRPKIITAVAARLTSGGRYVQDCPQYYLFHVGHRTYCWGCPGRHHDESSRHGAWRRRQRCRGKSRPQFHAGHA
jgi:L-cysteate sulfo-lyase